MKNNTVSVKWMDSYSIYEGWTSLEDDFSADLCIIESWGKVIYEDDKVIALAHNYADETEHTRKQVSGVMVIPRICITEIIPV